MKQLAHRICSWFVMLFALVFFASAVHARGLSISMAFLPNILETPDNGVLLI